MTFLNTQKQTLDEFSNDLTLSLTEDDIEILKLDECIMEFLVLKLQTFSNIRHIAPRILIAIESSTPHERDSAYRN